MADIHRAHSGDQEIVTLGGELTVPHAKVLKAALLGAMTAAPAVIVAVENVTDMDISFPQLLCSAHRTAAVLNKGMTITGLEGERFGELLRQAGFFRHIGCQESTRKCCLWLHDQGTD